MEILTENNRQPVKPAMQTKDRAALRALAILEQMYGYFSFDPMPLETDRRLAA